MATDVHDNMRNTPIDFGYGSNRCLARFSHYVDFVCAPFIPAPEIIAITDSWVPDAVRGNTKDTNMVRCPRCDARNDIPMTADGGYATKGRKCWNCGYDWHQHHEYAAKHRDHLRDKAKRANEIAGYVEVRSYNDHMRLLGAVGVGADRMKMEFDASYFDLTDDRKLCMTVRHPVRNLIGQTFNVEAYGQPFYVCMSADEELLPLLPHWKPADGTPQVYAEPATDEVEITVRVPKPSKMPLMEFEDWLRTAIQATFGLHRQPPRHIITIKARQEGAAEAERVKRSVTDAWKAMGMDWKSKL